ncbi:MAG: rhomboid family intramembrane serine protease [Dysgonamonadaceae bacterium]|jgi:membrane associated rhomboid family serine protease|nr:rhomboid family intramembrane serine protease [Dysgonamonadaceae bacterium]
MRIEEKKIVYSLAFPALFVVALWLILLLERGLGTDLYQWGIYPRSERGLLGIFTSPLIHLDFKHLFSNSVPLLALGWCLFYFYGGLSFAVIPCAWILQGIFTWLLGRESWHIGASGLIYAVSFFLFFSGIFRKHLPLMSVSLLVVFLYGSMIWTMFPVAELVDPMISWEGHLSGAAGGLICAWLFIRKGPQKPDEIEEEEEEENEDDNGE